MEISENISLKPYNSFGIEATARHFAVFNSMEQLFEIQDKSNLNRVPSLILGGGSNLLFTRDINGLVLKNNMVVLTVMPVI